MFETKWCNYLLNLVPQNKWNVLSKFVAAFSLPTVGSPLKFSYGDFTLKEYSMQDMGPELREEFFKFCYPADLHDRERELEYDRQYRDFASTFIIFDRSNNNEIVGCTQFIPKIEGGKIPAEYSRYSDHAGAEGGYFDPFRENRSERYAEIYRCRRSFSLRMKDSLVVVSMLFKAVWAKIIQTRTEYLYITFDADNRELRNLYTKKLFFQNPDLTVRYGSDPKQWRLFYKDCRLHEEKLATLDRSHFYLQTWFRRNLRKKVLRTRPRETAPAMAMPQRTPPYRGEAQPEPSFAIA